MKDVTILTPYGGEGTEESPYGPLVADLLGDFTWTDVTARPMGNGKPMRNMYAIRAKLTDDQVKAVRQDNRFFISAKPEPAYRASDVDQWLKNRGFTDHPVKSGDTEDEAFSNLRGYFKSL